MTGSVSELLHYFTLFKSKEKNTKYSTLALVSGRLPTLALNLAMPYMVSVMPGNKYEKLFEQSYVCSKLRNVYAWIENTFRN